MNDFFRISADSVGIAVTSEPVSIYLSWLMVAALVILAFAPRAIRAIRSSVKASKRQSVTEWAQEQAKRTDGGDLEPYAW